MKGISHRAIRLHTVGSAMKILSESIRSDETPLAAISIVGSIQHLHYSALFTVLYPGKIATV